MCHKLQDETHSHELGGTVGPPTSAHCVNSSEGTPSATLNYGMAGDGYPSRHYLELRRSETWQTRELERETPSLSLRLTLVPRFSGLANATRTRSNRDRVCSTRVRSSFDRYEKSKLPLLISQYQSKSLPALPGRLTPYAICVKLYAICVTTPC
jgi:hypothetical protein